MYVYGIYWSIISYMKIKSSNSHITSRSLEVVVVGKYSYIACAVT